MGVYDDTARFTCKLDGPGFFAWLLRHLTPPPPLTFGRWDDARRVNPPGWPERTDDVVAVLQHVSEPSLPSTWVIVESETEPERFIFHRLGVYGLLLSMELARGSVRGEEPTVGIVLLNLAGDVRESRLRVAFPGTDRGFSIEPLVINFRNFNAEMTLAEIDSGQTARCLLPWIPLMAEGGRPDIVARWKQLALRETDLALRGLYRDLVLVFAELCKHQVTWYQALEEWNMIESPLIRSWFDRGHQKGVVEKARADLLDAIRLRLADPVPDDIRLAIEGTNDEVTLQGWFRSSLTCGTLADFQDKMRREP